MYTLGYDAEGNAPDWFALLGRLDMWAEAMGQIFFSLGICMGGMTSIASYNPKNKPIISDGCIIAFGNSGFSMIAGFGVFAIIGYLIYIDSPVSSNVGSMGLAFVAYPTAIALMPWANFWSALFSSTLFMLGIDSAFTSVEAINTVFHDTA